MREGGDESYHPQISNTQPSHSWPCMQPVETPCQSGTAALGSLPAAHRLALPAVRTVLGCRCLILLWSNCCSLACSNKQAGPANQLLLTDAPKTTLWLSYKSCTRTGGHLAAFHVGGPAAAAAPSAGAAAACSACSSRAAMKSICGQGCWAGEGTVRGALEGTQDQAPPTSPPTTSVTRYNLQMPAPPVQLKAAPSCPAAAGSSPAA